MNTLPFALQLGLIVAAAALVAAWAVNWALRARQAGAAPVIRASFRALQPGWYQLDIDIANRAPYAVLVDELKRLKPRSARLMAPIKQVATREGNFQVWTHPSTDKASVSIPLDLTLGPYEARRAHGIARASEGHATAWLFLSGQRDWTEVTLELSWLDGAGHPRRWRFAARGVG